MTRRDEAAPDPTAPLSIRDLTVAYQRKPVLWDVDLECPEPGHVYGLIGPNGAGKSTLLRAVLDLVPRVSGRVRVFGKPYRRQRARVEYSRFHRPVPLLLCWHWSRRPRAAGNYSPGLPRPSSSRPKARSSSGCSGFSARISAVPRRRSSTSPLRVRVAIWRPPAPANT